VRRIVSPVVFVSCSMRAATLTVSLADEGELELATAADGAGDHDTGVDPDAEPGGDDGGVRGLHPRGARPEHIAGADAT
jgi:hypothetical protein